jgi:hypothetical protein
VVEHDVEVVIERELALLTRQVRRSEGELAALLAADFGEIGASGRLWTRAEMIDALTAAGAEEEPTVRYREMRGRSVGQDLVLLNYISEVDGRRARRSSLWRRCGRTWQIVHHQGTPVP